MQAPKVIILRQETNPLHPGAKVWRAFYEDGTPLYMSHTFLDDLKMRVKQHENVKEFRIQSQEGQANKTYTPPPWR